MTTAHSVVEPAPRAKRSRAPSSSSTPCMSIAPLLWIVSDRLQVAGGRDRLSAEGLSSSRSLEGYVNLFTDATRQTPEFIATLPPPGTWYDKLVRSRNMVIAGPSKVVPRFMNSIIIGFGSTFLAVVSRHARGLWVLALQGAARRRPVVLHPVDAHDAADRRRDPDLSHVPPARPYPTRGSA